LVLDTLDREQKVLVMGQIGKSLFWKSRLIVTSSENWFLSRWMWKKGRKPPNLDFSMIFFFKFCRFKRLIFDEFGQFWVTMFTSPT